MAENEADFAGPDINTDKVCFVIAKARELESGDEGISADASNPSDDQSVSILTDGAYGVTRQEIAAFIAALDEDEKNDLVALAWTGRGDFSADEWPDAVAEASARAEGDTAKYLLGLPLLAAYLEAGLDEFDLSCGDFDAETLGAPEEGDVAG